ncbi:MAG: hypothetical protein ACYTGH_02660, partial [Planctomycetota bacterium]
MTTDSNQAKDVPLDQLGIIPGVEETEAEQRARYASLVAFRDEVKAGLAKGEALELERLRFEPGAEIPGEVMAESQGPATAAYDFALDWVPGFYSDRGLGHFFGGMAMCFAETDEEWTDRSRPRKTIYLFQLREAFRKKARFLIYGREELVSHESCHIARMALQAHRYEEMLAYRISESKFRRYAGPIFSSTRQVPLFMLTLVIFLGSQV